MKQFFLICALMFNVLSVSALESRKQNMSAQEVNDLVARVYKAPTGKFISKQLNGPDNRGFRVVFAHNGKRYTVDHNWWTDGIQVWVRPVGTAQTKFADAFSDKKMTGVVDFGTDGKKKIFAVADVHYKGSVAKGLEHQPYWQKVYSEALRGLQATLR